MKPRSSDHTERAASEVISVVLIVGIVMLAVSAVLVIGMPAVDNSQTHVEVGQAERSMVQFSSEASRVTSGSTSTSDVDLGLRNNRGTLDVDSVEGTITIEYSEGLTGRDYIVKNQSMGTMTYEHGDTTIAYQGGGVWRSDGDGSMMVSPPDMEFREDTLKIPIVVIENEETVHTDVRVTSGQVEQHFPNESRELYSNRASTGTIFITIESEYYKAWARYFDEQSDEVFVDTSEEGIVEVIFYGTGHSISGDAGIITTSESGELHIEGSGSYIDSYNSTEGPYENSQSDDGDVRSAGHIDLSGGSQIYGNVDVEGMMEMGGESLISGDAEYGEELNMDGGAEIEGDIGTNPMVPRIPPLDPFIEQRGDELREDNNNDETDFITHDNELDFNAEDARELGHGEYYLKNIKMEDGETLIMNTDGGNITVFVEEYVVLDEGSIEVEGDGNVRLIMGSNEGADISTPGFPHFDEPHLWVSGEGSHIAVEDQSAPRFQIVGPAKFRGAVRNSDPPGATVTAMILAPTPKYGDEVGEFHVRASKVYGSIVAGEVQVENNAQVHFDHATSDVGVPFEGDDPLVDYLYVSINGIEIKES